MVVTQDERDRHWYMLLWLYKESVGHVWYSDEWTKISNMLKDRSWH